GDLLPEPRRHPAEGFNESIIGTGFWFLGEAAHSPVDVRADQAARIDNQIDVFSKAFLGLTVSCARCHDHKFDAITTKDYYALAGFLESSRWQHAFIDAPDRAGELIGDLRRLQLQMRKAAVHATGQALSERAGQLAKVLLGSRLAAGAAEPIDAGLRERWIKAMGKTGAYRPEHLFYAWQVLSNHQNEESFIAVRKAALAQLKAAAGRAIDADKRSVVFADFSRQSFKDWYVTGDAFGSGPTTSPIAVLSPDQPGVIKQIVGAGVAHSGLVSHKLQGVLRSKTFVISKKKINYHIAGKGGQVNLIVDGLQLIRDPIYGGLTFKVDHGEQMSWKTMDVSMWQGHKAYIEIIDDGPGYITVDKIVFSDDTPQPPAPNYLL